MDTLIMRIILSIATFILVVLPKASYAFQNPIDSISGLETDSLLALEYHKLGVKYYSKWNNQQIKEPNLLDSAIKRTELSLGIRESLWKDVPNIHLGKSYHNLGTFLKFKGDIKGAKRYLKEAVSVFTLLNHERILRSLLELGKIYEHEGDFVSAEDYYAHAIKVAIDIRDELQIRYSVIDLGSVYINSFRDSLAILHLEKYKDYFDIPIQKDKDNYSGYYNNLASTYMRNDKLDEAIRTFLKASQIDKSNFITQARVYTNLSIPYRLKKKFSKCYEALLKGKELAYQSQDHNVMSFNHKGMAKYYEAKSDFESALSQYQKAIALMVPSFTPESNYDNPNAKNLTHIVNKVNLLSYFSDKVKVLIQMGKENSSSEILELYKLGDMVIDKLRSDHFIYDTKLYWRNIAFPFYEEALSYCYKEKAYDDAFYFFEKGKSVLLLEGYSFNESISKTLKKDKDRYLKLKAALSQSQEKYGSELIEDIVNSQRNFELFIDSLSITYPHLFKMQKDLFLLSLEEFQQNEVKDSNTIFIHYFYGKDSVFAFGIEKENVAFMNLGNASQFDSLILALKQYYHHPAKIDNDFEKYKMVSNKLYESLLAPLINAKHKEIVIMPDGLIATIPFESLISNIKERQSPRYVIEDKVIRYSFSGSILNNMNDAEYRLEHDVVTFVPFGNDENSQGKNFSGVHEQDFKTAKQNGIEIKHFRGDEASKDNLMSFNKRLPILHFSSHGFEDEGEEPKILLANSSITLSDLYTSSLPADMVFLSACRTNSGENAFGEGIQSMARGFTFAGANSVISSLWNVIASPNSNIVRRFYENLSLGQTKHLALHNAKLTYLSDTNVPLFEKSPYYWAGMVYYGEADYISKIKEGKSNNLFSSILLLISVLLVGFIGYRLYKNRQA